ncbi:MAG TPA: hypothetical protein VGO22_03555 [Pseudorhizobium sp.]|jgi:hypothetical protein|nr:hypothetical protein [Pseudorhizobium sp.]
MHIKLTFIASVLLFVPTTGLAQEGLEMFSGNWTGSGEFVRLNGDRVDVQCNLKTEASSASLIVNGRCTALVFISRDLSANIKAEGGIISGEYSGPEGNGSVQGERTGKALNLAIQWEKPVRGDKTASMKIEMIGADQLRLQTFDLDPATNSMAAVTDLNLQRQ